MFWHKMWPLWAQWVFSMIQLTIIPIIPTKTNQHLLMVSSFHPKISIIILKKQNPHSTEKIDEELLTFYKKRTFNFTQLLEKVKIQAKIHTSYRQIRLNSLRRIYSNDSKRMIITSFTILITVLLPLWLTREESLELLLLTRVFKILVELVGESILVQIKIIIQMM